MIFLFADFGLNQTECQENVYFQMTITSFKDKHGRLIAVIRIFEAINQNIPDGESLHDSVFFNGIIITSCTCITFSGGISRKA